ncbi:MAG: MFS transporter [Leptolinea sp.]|jgi:fucose permease|nr:MFS transporter [Leptolinea sp.]
MTFKEKLNTRKSLILLAFIAFIALGLPDGLLGVGWPSIRRDFNLPLDAMGMLLFTATAGYLTSSFFNGKLIARFGIGGLLAMSCALTGITLIGYSVSPAWGLIVLLGITAGLGAGAIDAGLNTYVAANFNEGLMQWLHASYGIGVTCSPLIMSFAVNTLNSWRLGYDIVGFFQLLLAACFFLSLRLWTSEKKPAGSDEVKKLTDYRTSYLETLRQSRVWLSLLLFFIYTGAEVSLGAWAYTLLTQSRGIAPSVAGILTGSYWAFFTVGRFSAGLYTRRIKLHTLIYASILLAMTGVALLWWNPSDTVSLIGIGLTGLAIAPIFPGMMSGTSERVLPRYAANTIGMEMSAAGVGSAAVPATIGILANNTTLEVIPACLFGLFLILLGVYTYTVLTGKKAKQTSAIRLNGAEVD